MQPHGSVCGGRSASYRPVYIKRFLIQWFDIDKEEFSPYLFIYEQEGAVEHLFKVATGLNSMVLGETQILGQVRSSFLLAQRAGATGTVFNSSIQTGRHTWEKRPC